MLSTPKFGWTTISLGEWSDRASYLTDVPMDILNALIDAYKSRNPASIKFDAEGHDYIIVIDDWETYVIAPEDCESEFPTLTIVPKNKKELSTEIISDIEKDFDGWVDWNLDFTGETDNTPIKEERRRQLKAKIETLKILNQL